MCLSGHTAEASTANVSATIRGKTMEASANTSKHRGEKFLLYLFYSFYLLQ